VKEMQALGVKAVGIVSDFSTEEGCKKFAAEAASQWAESTSWSTTSED